MVALNGVGMERSQPILAGWLDHNIKDDESEIDSNFSFYCQWLVVDRTELSCAKNAVPANLWDFIT